MVPNNFRKARCIATNRSSVATERRKKTINDGHLKKICTTYSSHEKATNSNTHELHAKTSCDLDMTMRISYD